MHDLKRNLDGLRGSLSSLLSGGCDWSQFLPDALRSHRGSRTSEASGPEAQVRGCGPARSGGFLLLPLHLDGTEPLPAAIRS